MISIYDLAANELKILKQKRFIEKIDDLIDMKTDFQHLIYSMLLVKA